MNLYQTSSATWETTDDLICTKCNHLVQEVIEFKDKGSYCWKCLHGATYEALINDRTILMRDVKCITYANKVRSKKEERQKMNKSLRYKILKRDGFKCKACGNTAEEIKLQIDHIHPVSKGGRTTENNLQTLCLDCNQGKGDKI